MVVMVYAHVYGRETDTESMMGKCVAQASLKLTVQSKLT